MKTIDNILVPIDFTEISIFGIKAARDLASKFGSKVHLTHFVAPTAPMTGLSPQTILGELELLEKQRSSIMGEKLMKLQGLMEKYIFEENRGSFNVVPASLFDHFDQLCKKAKIDVVVSGTSGSRSKLEWVAGNKTENMIRQVDVPFLVVSDDKPIAYNQVLIATDLSVDIPSQLYDFCAKLSNKGTTVHIANVVTSEDTQSSEEAIYNLNAMANKNGLMNFRWHITQNENLLDGLKEIVAKIQPDLILMKTYEKSGFWSFLSGSIAEAFIRKTNIPTMVETV